MARQGTDQQKVRLDKWLWAARFFKTRAQAKVAIEGGKVQIDGQRAKSSKDIPLGAAIKIRQGWNEKIVIVDNVTDQRRGATEAAALYSETPESISQREQRIVERKASNQSLSFQDQRPNKKQRRQIHRFKEDNQS
ncbi:MAG: ribosome-associated heat shock protein Hsp15 [Porticoccus sp.]|jgi:ribosome-associated heat shock protein Hsp15